MPSNIVLAVDPGFDRVGVAVVEKDRVLFSDCVVTSRKIPHAERLLIISNALQAIIKEWQPNSLAIEKLFFNQNATNALKVSEARGVVLAESARAGLEVFEYSPQEVKIAITGYGKADKKQVESMIKKLVKNLSLKKKFDDELDAIGIGICHLATKR